jgi:hypothetical protein
MNEIQMMAYAGELAAWLMEDKIAAARFAAWYNDKSVQLRVSKPIIQVSDVQNTCRVMFYWISELSRER